MKNLINDPKYIIIDGALANAHTKEFIPEDEPIFIIRGKDVHAVAALVNYMRLAHDEEHKKAIGRRLSAFHKFASEHNDRMDEPDTLGADDWPDIEDNDDVRPG